MFTESSYGLPSAAVLRRRLGLGFCPPGRQARWNLFIGPAFSFRWRWGAIVFFAAAALLFFAGCQRIVAEPYPTSQELKNRQTRSWEELASQMAERIGQELTLSETYRALPVFVKTPEASVFAQTFGQMLKGQLSRRGLRLSDTPVNAIILEYQAAERRYVNIKLIYEHKTILTETRHFDPGPTELTREMADAVWERYAKRRAAMQ